MILPYVPTTLAEVQPVLLSSALTGSSLWPFISHRGSTHLSKSPETWQIISSVCDRPSFKCDLLAFPQRGNNVYQEMPPFPQFASKAADVFEFLDFIYVTPQADRSRGHHRGAWSGELAGCRCRFGSAVLFVHVRTFGLMPCPACWQFCCLVPFPPGLPFRLADTPGGTHHGFPCFLSCWNSSELEGSVSGEW